ncbi:uncharacterized protein F4807DRAFT_127114 [Annulohypoxylon truncatum]|uniref:uncharacterized protein n=1 Tax=Annulohypoxylon truncatum TaxID=327061 RepID=UPI002008B8CD|nr:uncharacterized protein F4807DRAFT_127114 [Annulohypoxylon truncatum]KAI1214406.1 hypothetical protein F4807DRAFT_127114 [Annulohypoxylon truncatum]
METRGYTQLDRANVLRTLESRLSASQDAVQGPQVQLFRVNSPTPDTAPPNFTMPHWKPGEESPNEEPSKDVRATTPSEHLIQSYNKRIQVMQAIINQLRTAEKDRHNVEDDLKKVREELDRAKTRIGNLEDELEQSVEELKAAIEQRDVAIENANRYCKEAEAAGKRCSQLEYTNKGLCTVREDDDNACNDVVRLHNVIWGSRPIFDESLNQRLMEHAARGSSFAATRDFIDYDVRPGERRTLIVAYSKAPDGPVRWLVVDENVEMKFDLY